MLFKNKYVDFDFIQNGIFCVCKEMLLYKKHACEFAFPILFVLSIQIQLLLCILWKASRLQTIFATFFFFSFFNSLFGLGLTGQGGKTKKNFFHFRQYMVLLQTCHRNLNHPYVPKSSSVYSSNIESLWKVSTQRFADYF